MLSEEYGTQLKGHAAQVKANEEAAQLQSSRAQRDEMATNSRGPRAKLVGRRWRAEPDRGEPEVESQAEVDSQAEENQMIVESQMLKGVEILDGIQRVELQRKVGIINKRWVCQLWKKDKCRNGNSCKHVHSSWTVQALDLVGR